MRKKGIKEFKAKQPWELTGDEFEIRTQPLRAALKRIGFTKAIAVESAYKEIEKAYPWIRQIPKQLKHKSIVQKAIKKGKPVPRQVLEEYRGEKWAHKALEKAGYLDERRGMTTEEEVRQAVQSGVFKRETAKYHRETQIELQRRRA